MITKLVIENLKHRWVRTFLCALVVGVQVMSILTIIGLSRGLLRDSARRAEGTGADIWLKSGGASLSLSSGQVLQKFVPFVQKQPHVRKATGVLIQPLGGTDILSSINGVNFNELDYFNGGFRYLKGGEPAGDDEVVVDEHYAQQHKVEPGQILTLLNHKWKVSGIMQSGMLGRLAVKLDRLQELSNNTGKISQVLVKLDDSNNTADVVKQLNKALEGNLIAISFKDFVGQFSINSIPQLQTFIWVITGLAVVVGFLVVFLSMYTAVVERTREIGILKALGAKPATVVDILVREAVVLALAGCVLGIAMAYLAKAVISGIAPASLPIISVPDWWLKAAGIALLGALLGAIYPGLKAARQDAIEALAYE